MYMQPPQKKHSRMVATKNDPWISVSLLAEFVFCPRAGIIQHRNGTEDIEDEWESKYRSRRHRHKIFYSLEQIKHEIRNLNTTLVLTGMAMVIFAIAIIAGFAFHTNKALPYGSICAFGVLWLYALYTFFKILWIFFVHYMPYRTARASIPEVDHTEPQPIKWRSLIKAGFRPVNPHEPFKDEKWHLVGCPWRILVKGDLRIPVFKKRASQIDRDRLYRQHYARMAAYCHLIETNERATSPYGIVLFGNSLKGTTVPINPASNKAFHDGLEDARHVIASLGHSPPPSPPSETRCLNCPHSWRDRETGTSTCGSIFHWVPPNSRDDNYWY